MCFVQNLCVLVINGLMNEYYLCQVFVDIFMYYEYCGLIVGKIVVWVGDVNNMFYMWIEVVQIFGFKLCLLMLFGYVFDMKFVLFDSVLFYEVFDDLNEVCKGVDFVMIDVWMSMGFEVENEVCKQVFVDWCVDEEMMGYVNLDVFFMYCLFVYCGEEVMVGVIDGLQSVVWDEVENCLYVQKVLMEFLLFGCFKY